MASRPAGATIVRHPTGTPVLGTVAALLATILVACGTGTSGPTSTPQASSPALQTPTPVPGGASPSPIASLPPQADTGWGRIWEGLPTGFPHFAGAEPTEVGGTEPTSATLDIPSSAGSVSAITSFYRSGLEAAGYSVSVDGPLENGATTISATGPAGCATQVTVAPLGGSITVTILYGAACPFT